MLVFHDIYQLLKWTWGGYPFTSDAAGYNIFSGPLPDLVFVGVAVQLYRRHNCHEERCWRLSWHTDATGHPVCKVHHPDHPKGKQRRFLAIRNLLRAIYRHGRDFLLAVRARTGKSGS